MLAFYFRENSVLDAQLSCFLVSGHAVCYICSLTTSSVLAPPTVTSLSASQELKKIQRSTRAQLFLLHGLARIKQASFYCQQHTQPLTPQHE